MTANNLDIALYYAKNFGWKLFPCEWALDPISKPPNEFYSHMELVKCYLDVGMWDCENVFRLDVISSDPDTIKGWARKWPHCYFCVALSPSKLIDFIIKKNEKFKRSFQPFANLEHLEIIHGKLPPTLTISGPSSGSLHYIYNHPAEVEYYGCLSDQEIAPDIITQCDLIPLPGSYVHGKGVYSVVSGNTPVAPMPKWLPDVVKQADDKYATATKKSNPIPIKDVAEQTNKTFNVALKKCPQDHPFPKEDPSPNPFSSIKDAVFKADKFTDLPIPPKTIYLDPWLTAQTIIMIVGYRGLGKTWFVLSLLMAIAKNKNFGPWEILNGAPVLYYDAEMVAYDIKERLLQFDDGSSCQNPFYVYSDAFATRLGIPRGDLLDPEWRTAIKNVLLELGVKIWAIDNISSLTTNNNENNKKEWSPINSWLLDLRFAGITTILLHHTNKAGDQRGTSSREDNIDISIMLKKPSGYSAEDGAKFITSFTKSRIRTAELHKLSKCQFQLMLDNNDKVYWNWSKSKRDRKTEIIRLKNLGWDNTAIATEVSCSLPNIGQILKRSIKEGLLTEDGKLTTKGSELIAYKPL